MVEKLALGLISLLLLLVDGEHRLFSVALTISRKTLQPFEGQSCNTTTVLSGVCTKESQCDTAFLHFMKYHEFVEVCHQNAFEKVQCCQPFLDLCKTALNISYHIYQGQPAKEGAFPHLARLGATTEDNTTKWFCGGNVISERFLLTAAHCSRVRIAGFGCHDSLPCEQKIPIKEFVKYPSYKKTLKYHDIALVQLEAAIRFGRRVLPICPYSKMEDLRSTQDLITAGWGQTEKYAESPQLMFGIVRTVAVSDCAERHKALPDILNRKLNRGVTDEMYCAIGEQGNNTSDFVDSCTGDSGGPLQMEYQGNVFLVGIVSTGHGCGSSLPALYTRVSYYFDWINEKMTELMTQTAGA